jgi:hypothetical protein
MLAQLIRTGARRHRLEFVSAVVSLILVVGIAAGAPPLPRSFAAASPFTEALTDSARHDSYARLLFAVSEPGHKLLLSRYASAAEDEYVNAWLLQSTAQRGTEAIRYYSYFMDPTDPKLVCAAIETWGKGVTVETTVRGWGAQLHASCPAEKFTVRLRQEGWP